jgi:hypothetical protein
MPQIQVDWLSGGLAVLAALCLYRSVTYVQGTGGFVDPQTKTAENPIGASFPHVRVNKRLMLLGLILGVLSAAL